MKILLIGDVHSAFGNIEKLKYFLKHNEIVIDSVLLNGDIINLCHPCEENNKDLDEFAKVLNSILQVSKKLLYVPGNHDPAIISIE